MFMKGFVTLFKQALVSCLPKLQKVDTKGFSPNGFCQNTKFFFMRGIFTPSLVPSEKSFAGSFKICLILLLSFVVVRSEGQISKRLGDVITNLDITCTAGPCTPAGTIVIDGNPCDWNQANFSTFPIRSYQLDAFGNGQVDNQFTEGSKDFFEAHDLIWSISQTKAK